MHLAAARQTVGNIWQLVGYTQQINNTYAKQHWLETNTSTH